MSKLRVVCRVCACSLQCRAYPAKLSAGAQHHVPSSLKYEQPYTTEPMVHFLEAVMESQGMIQKHTSHYPGWSQKAAARQAGTAGQSTCRSGRARTLSVHPAAWSGDGEMQMIDREGHARGVRTLLLASQSITLARQGQGSEYALEHMSRLSFLS